jgi:hypothetical protein
MTFFDQYDIDDIVTVDELLEFADGHGNGLDSTKFIEDPRKRANTVKRYLNDGGSSRGLAEPDRRILVTTDAKRGTLIVKQLSDHVVSSFPDAVRKSTRGAMIPLKKQEQATADINLEELPSDQRKLVENVIAIGNEVIRVQRAGTREMLTTLAIQTLVVGGNMTEKQARYVIEHQMGTFGDLQKLFKLTE